MGNTDLLKGMSSGARSATEALQGGVVGVEVGMRAGNKTASEAAAAMEQEEVRCGSIQVHQFWCTPEPDGVGRVGDGYLSCECGGHLPHIAVGETKTCTVCGTRAYQRIKAPDGR